MFVALGVLCTVGYTAYAITGSNTVPVTTAGDGTGAVNPYVASNIDYTLNLLTSYNIDAVTFTLAPAAAGSVKIVLNGSVYSCINHCGLGIVHDHCTTGDGNSSDDDEGDCRELSERSGRCPWRPAIPAILRIALKLYLSRADIATNGFAFRPLRLYALHLDRGMDICPFDDDFLRCA